jgi:hypothetical protein
MDTDFGTVEHEGVTIRLTGWAFNTNWHEGVPQYAARGVDAEGNKYLVTWDVRDEFFELEDFSLRAIWKTEEEFGRPIEEDDLCDWNNPVKVEQI